MPLHRLALEGLFGDVVGAEKGDAGADEPGGDVEEAVVSGETVHERVVHQHLVMEPFRTDVRMSLAEPVDVVDALLCQIRVYGVADDYVALLVVLFSDIGFDG